MEYACIQQFVTQIEYRVFPPSVFWGNTARSPTSEVLVCKINSLEKLGLNRLFTQVVFQLLKGLFSRCGCVNLLGSTVLNQVCERGLLLSKTLHKSVVVNMWALKTFGLVCSWMDLVLPQSISQVVVSSFWSYTLLGLQLAQPPVRIKERWQLVEDILSNLDCRWTHRLSRWLQMSHVVEELEPWAVGTLVGHQVGQGIVLNL